MTLYRRLVAQLHHIEANSPAQADRMARITADAVNKSLRPLGMSTAWAPMVTDPDSDDGGLDDILLGLYLLDEVDDDPSRNPRPGYVAVEETMIPERLIAWRDAAVKTAVKAALESR